MRILATVTAIACVVLAGCASNNLGTTRGLAANGSAVYPKAVVTPRTSTPRVEQPTRVAGYHAPSVQTYAARQTQRPAARSSASRSSASRSDAPRTVASNGSLIPPPPPPPPLYGSSSSAAPVRYAAPTTPAAVPAVRTPPAPAGRAAPATTKRTYPGWNYDPFRSAGSAGGNNRAPSAGACKT